MSSFKIPVNREKRLVVLSILVICIWWILSCTYEPLPPPEMPKFYQTINLPLVDASFYLSELQDSTNHIYGDSLSDSLYFMFSGDLDTATLTEDIFLIPAVGTFQINQDFSEIDQANINIDKSISQKIKLSEISGISFPLPYDFTIPSIPRIQIIDEEQTLQLFDRNSIPYFKRVDYLTIKEGNLSVHINNRLHVTLDSVLISLNNVNMDTLARCFYKSIPHGEDRDTTIDLSGKKLRDSVKLVIKAFIAEADQVTIPAGEDPYAEFEINFKIGGIKSITGIPEPIEMEVSQDIPPSNNTIIRAVIGYTTTNPPDTNLITLGVNNTLPINFNMNIKFMNFYTSEGALELDLDVLTDNDTTEITRLDGDTLRNPDASTVVESILIYSSIYLLPDVEGDSVVTIPLDMEGGSIDITFQITTIKLEEIVGFFNESFAIPPLTISNIPTGFSDINFGSVLLNLHFFNEIQAQTNLSLNLQGFREGFEPVLIEVEDSILKAEESRPVAKSDIQIDIAPIFNMVPDSILVSGEAAIPANDTSKLQVGKSFWGSYDIIVPFQVKTEPMTFIPVKSTVLDPMDEKTADQIRAGLIEASIIANVVNDFPLSGSVEILFSNYDYFPLDSNQAEVDTGYQWINDSLFAISEKETVYIDIDTLIAIVLPEPVKLNNYGSVETPGELFQVSTLDSTNLEAIMSDKEHYIRPRIYLNGTEDFVSVGYNDQIQILAMISFTINTSELINPEEESEQDTMNADDLKKPTIYKEKFDGIPCNKENRDCEDSFRKKESFNKSNFTF